MTEGFMFGGRSTREFDMHVESYPTQKTAARKLETIQVPGRSGALHLLQEAFANYTQEYSCYFHGTQDMPKQAHDVKGWLMGAGANARLEDEYDPEHFRLATFIGPMDIENTLNRYGRCVVAFDCAPQAYLKSGELPIDFENPGQLYNPTQFSALPMIYVRGSGAGTVTVGGTEVTVNEIDGQLILDCELLNAYIDGGEGLPQNKNNCIFAPEFPRLRPGANAVGWTGDITGVTIIPRWWEL